MNRRPRWLLGAAAVLVIGGSAAALPSDPLGAGSRATEEPTAADAVSTPDPTAVSTEPATRSGPEWSATMPTPAPFVPSRPTTIPVPGSTASPQTPPDAPSSSPVALAEMPDHDLPGWELVFSDDFERDVPLGRFPDAVSSRWDAYPEPWADTSGNGVYAPERTVSIANSIMDIWLHTEDGRHLVAAPMPKLPGGKHQLYGRYAVRFRADVIPGYKLAWLLWPQSEMWPRDGEMDFPDQDLEPGARIHAFMHRQDAAVGSDQDAYESDVHIAGTEWHTAVVEWQPGSMKFILDGEVIGHSTERVPNTPMRWVLQSETSLRPEPPLDSVEGHVQIDWVAVWRYAP